jgi:2-polyprenyl-3-methyl-5-hydroxy-6-metoxy-1,4-benzoquinol methylase
MEKEMKQAKSFVEKMQNYSSAQAGFTEQYKGTPPWDIGKPQAQFIKRAKIIKGKILDVGCGTGNTAIYFAAHGLKVTGIDFVEAAISKARTKANQKNLSVNFLVKDAMTLREWDEKFDSVIDSGLFHIYAGDERQRYVEGLLHVIKPNGRLFLLSFTDQALEGGVSDQELRDVFSEGWEIESLELVRGEVSADFLKKFPDIYPEGGPKMWFAMIRKMGS